MLQDYLRGSPEALVFFDAQGSCRFASHRGEVLYQRWNRALRPDQARHQLPAAFIRVFNGERAELGLQHPGLIELTATLSPHPLGIGGPGGRQAYVLRLFDRNVPEGVGTLSPPAIAALRKLTPAEQRVARLVLDGLRNDQIAERLCRSTRTVEFQLNSAYRKLAIANRLQLSRLLS